jgi:5-methylcytosine-specific restriction endonuclease McrA
MSPAINQQGWVQTWVTSQWKNRPIPGQFSAEINNLASTVDHIIQHRGDHVLFWNRSNWQPLCARCHNSVKQRLERSARP